MNAKKIYTIIIFGIISILSILIIQVYWIQKSQEVGEQRVEIQQRQDSLNYKQFVQNVQVSLTDVAQKIQTIKKDSSELYDVVKQLSTNYFTVQINETLDPYLLERILKNAFDKKHIREDFQYGIYDCFTDSIVYGNLIQYESILDTDSTTTTSSIETPQIKWDRDGHYFTVLFPNVENASIEALPASNPPWFFVIIITCLSLGFFAYAVYIILQQRKLSDMKTDFINNMTHELKTPISTISLSSSTILRDELQNDPERLQKYASIIYKENKRLEKQVERVLSIAKLDKQEVQLRKENLDLHEIIRESTENFQLGQMELNDGKIELKLGANPCLVFADEVHLVNVIYNLMDNAIKYCSEKPEITVTTSNSKNGISLEISDNGIGIKRENQKYIFDKFYRVPTGDLHDVKGFGLGLFYVKEILERHGGSISLKSTYGKGTTFKIWLPTH
jgi:two-component system phosphate regulon sensor histidine kinase PhoR